MHKTESSTEISDNRDNQSNTQFQLEEHIAKLQERLNEMEIKLIFQDDLLNTLNDIVTRQDQEIMKLWDANRLLKQSMQDIKDGSDMSKEGFIEPPPPHY